MKKVLVIGGAGFIGSHLVEALLERGYQVRVVDNLSTGSMEHLPQHDELEFVRGDITDYEICLAAMEEVEGVFHLAAMSKLMSAVVDPDMIDSLTQQNIIGTTNVLRAALRHKDRVRKVVFSGSSAYYGAGPVPCREDVLHDCQTPYAVTKYVGEMYCEIFTRLHGLPTIRLRYFMTFGPRQPDSGAYAIASGVFMRRWLAGEPLPIFGTGKQTRDFVDVSEVAEGNVRAFESDLDDATINIGTGKAISILELAKIFSDELVFEPPRVADMPHSLADTTRCQQLLQWVPTSDVVAYFKDEVRRRIQQDPGRYRKPEWLRSEEEDGGHRSVSSASA